MADRNYCNYYTTDVRSVEKCRKEVIGGEVNCGPWQSKKLMKEQMLLSFPKCKYVLSPQKYLEQCDHGFEPELREMHIARWPFQRLESFCCAFVLVIMQQGGGASKPGASRR